MPFYDVIEYPRGEDRIRRKVVKGGKKEALTWLRHWTEARYPGAEIAVKNECCSVWVEGAHIADVAIEPQREKGWPE